jgi:hypothetical protein
MGITNAQSGTNVHEVADGIYRINTPVTIEGGPGGFSFNQYLVVDDEPLIFHIGPRKMFPLVREAVASVLPVERLRYIASRTSRRTSAGRSTNGSPSPHNLRPCVARSRRWFRLVIWPTGRPARSPMVKLYRLENTWCGGLTRRTCRTRGSAATSWRRVRGHSSAAICLRKAVLTTRPSRSRTSSDRARLSASRWTTFRTRRMPERC